MILSAVMKSAFNSASLTFVAITAHLPDGYELVSADFHVEGNRALIALARLELHGIAFIEVLDLSARRQAAPVKEDLVAAVVRDDKSIALLLDYFFDGSRHALVPPLVATRPLGRVATILDNVAPPA